MPEAISSNTPSRRAVIASADDSLAFGLISESAGMPVRST
jgi:hypothetical protein